LAEGFEPRILFTGVDDLIDRFEVGLDPSVIDNAVSRVRVAVGMDRRPAPILRASD